MGSFSFGHWALVLLIVLLIFGTKRLRGAGRDLGEAIKGFKKGMSEDDTPSAELSDQSHRGGSSTQSKSQPGSEQTPR